MATSCRRAGRERVEHALVLLREAFVPAQGIEPYQDTQSVAAEGERHEQRGDPRAGAARPREQIGADAGESVGPTGFEHLARGRALGRDPQLGLAVELAGGRRHPQLAAVVEQNQQRSSFDQRPAALDDRLQDSIEVCLAADRAGDLGRCLEAADGALEVVALSLDVFVETSVVDRDRGPLGEDQRRLLVDVVEVAGGLLGQVEIAPSAATDHDRHPEEVGHRRVSGRKSVGAWVLSDIGQSHRPRLLDQESQHSTSAREAADRQFHLLLDAAGDEPLQLLAVAVQHADRCVTGAGQLAGDLEHASQDRLCVALCDQATADIDQPPQPPLVEAVAVICRKSHFIHSVSTDHASAPPLHCANSPE